MNLWNAATGQVSGGLKGHTQGVCRLTWSPNGRQLASAGEDGAVRLWEPATGEELLALEGPAGSVSSVAWSPDGRWLASGHANRMVLVWDRYGSASQRADPLPAGALRQAWTDLAGPGPQAYQAAGRLVGAAAQAVPLLRETLQPVPRIEGRKLMALIGQLNSDEFAEREKAAETLASLGGAAGPSLRQALARKLSPEQRRHVQALLSKLDAPPTGAELQACARWRCWRASARPKPAPC